MRELRIFVIVLMVIVASLLLAAKVAGAAPSHRPAVSHSWSTDVPYIGLAGYTMRCVHGGTQVDTWFYDTTTDPMVTVRYVTTLNRATSTWTATLPNQTIEVSYLVPNFSTWTLLIQQQKAGVWYYVGDFKVSGACRPAGHVLGRL